MKFNKTILSILLFAVVLVSISAISAEDVMLTTTSADNVLTVTANEITVTSDETNITSDDNTTETTNEETNTTEETNQTTETNTTINTNTTNITNQTGIRLTVGDFGYVIYGTPHDLTVTATNMSDNSPFIGRHLALRLTRLTGTVASKTYDSVTDINGTAKLEINLAPGQYSVNASYENYSTYQTFTIYRVPTFFIQSDFAVNRQGERYITRLYSLSGTGPVANETVYLTLTNGRNSKTYTYVTDDNGIVAMPINLGQGTYTINSYFPGGGAYSATTADQYNNTITIYPASHKMPSTISIIGSENSTVTLEKGTALRFRLSENNGLLMPQSTITVQLAQGSKRKTYTLNTGSTGEATLPINLGAGTYTITARYSGSYYFANTTTVNTLVVKA